MIMNLLPDVMYNCSYEISALIVLLVLIISIFTKKKLNTYDNRVFITMSIILFISIIVNIFTIYINTYYDMFPVNLIYLANMLYLGLSNTVIILFYFYVVYLATGENKNKTRFLTYILAISIYILILSTPFTKWIVYVDESGFHYGDYVIIIHALAAIICIQAAYDFIKTSFNFTIKQIIGFVVFMIIVFLADIYHYFFPFTPILSFSASISFIYILIFKIQLKEWMMY